MSDTTQLLLQSIRSGLTTAVTGGRFQIRRQLGSGGMGTVFEAYDTQLDRAVAIKFPTDVGEPDKERFRREAKTACQIEHRNVVKVFDIVDSNDEFFIVMEFVRGTALSDKAGSMTPAELKRAALDVLAGLEAIHARHLVHRDIKPNNLIERDGSIVIVDFGLAKSSNPTPAKPDLTEPGQFVGTPGFAPLEQMRGDADHKADLFGLGATLYYLICGRRPYEGNALEVFRKLLGGELPQPLPSRTVSTEFSAFVLKLLSPQKEDRPDALAATQLLSSSGDDAPAPRRSHWRLIALLLALLVVGTVVWMALYANERTRPGDGASDNTKNENNPRNNRNEPDPEPDPERAMASVIQGEFRRLVKHDAGTEYRVREIAVRAGSTHYIKFTYSIDKESEDTQRTLEVHLHDWNGFAGATSHSILAAAGNGWSDNLRATALCSFYRQHGYQLLGLALYSPDRESKVLTMRVEVSSSGDIDVFPYTE